MLNVTIVGSADDELEALVAGAQVAAHRVSSLDALTSVTPSPDVIMIDARVGKIPPGLAALKRQQPGLAILAVAKTLDSAFLLDAMRAGVNEVLPEPISHDELTAALRRVAGQRQFAEPGRAIGFIGAKGGIGTTTMAVNVATALALNGQPARTLLMDLHQAGGDTPLFFGVEPRFSTADALENTARLDGSFFRGLVTAVGGHLDLLSAPDRATWQPIEPAKLRHVLEFVRDAYRYVVIDLPRSDGAVLDALEQLSVIVVVANQELPTIRAAARLAKMLHHRYGRDKVRLVISRTDRHADITDEDLERAIGMPVMLQVPSAYRTAMHALHAGRPVVLENHSDLAHSFKQLALDLAGIHEPATSHEGLLRRLTHTVTGI